MVSVVLFGRYSVGVEDNVLISINVLEDHRSKCKNKLYWVGTARKHYYVFTGRKVLVIGRYHTDINNNKLSCHNVLKNEGDQIIQNRIGQFVDVKHTLEKKNTILNK